MDTEFVLFYNKSDKPWLFIVTRQSNCINFKMFITNLKTEFYEKLRLSKHRVLILVAQDVDALCACKILQKLFHCDNVLYTLVPVTDKVSLYQSFREHSEQIRYVVMINCGATFDVVEFLKAKEVKFFIIDSHRPIDVYNIYNGTDVCLLMKQNDEEGIPNFDEVFRDDESDDDELELTDEAIEKRTQKRKWLEKREKVLFEYMQFSYYGPSAAVTLFELAWMLSKDTNELLWWGIVGLTEQYLKGHIESNQYILDLGNVQRHVAHHNQKRNDENSLAIDCLKIDFENDLQLSLYRHWSIFESLKHTMYTACNFKLWTQKGEKRLCCFLAELGLPLTQCKQKFASMDINYRKNIKEWIEDMAEKYGLQKITYGTFVAYYGYRNKFNAMDVVRACSALLESTDRDKTPDERFLDAIDCLSKGNTFILERGIDLAKFQLMAVFKQVQAVLEMNMIVNAGPFLYVTLLEGSPDSRYFSHPGCLKELAHFLLNAHVTCSKSKKVKTLPLILIAPIADQAGERIVIGIPPIAEDSPKNFFGKAFEGVAKRMKNHTAVQDNFDPSIMQINNKDMTSFFDALISLLA